VRTFESAGIEYMLTGSFASSAQGEARGSHDIDFVVSLSPAHVPFILDAFAEPDFYVSEDAAREAIRNRRMFNILSVRDGDKIDLWMLTDELYDRTRFARRIEANVLGIKLKMSAPEDTILYKLRWAKLAGGSEKQFGDVLGVYDLQRGALDEQYMDRWAQKLGLTDLLEKVRAETT